MNERLNKWLFPSHTTPIQLKIIPLFYTLMTLNSLLLLLLVCSLSRAQILEVDHPEPESQFGILLAS